MGMWWSVAFGASVEAEIGHIPDGGSNGWDAAVRGVLVDAYDADHDGIVEGRDEVAAIPCAVWRALDRGVRQQWPAGLVQTYGFETGTWIGGAIGLGPAARRPSAQAVERCGVPIGMLVASAPAPLNTTDRVLAARALPGTDAWDAEVRGILLQAADGNATKAIDTREEVRALSCGAWLAVEQELRRAGHDGIRARYGLGGGAWNGDKLGFSEAVRESATEAVAACGVGITEHTNLEATLLINRLDALPDGGSDPWDAEVKKLVVNAFDADRSGSLDSVDEVDALGCDIWLAVDRGVRAGWGNGLYTIYGFGPGLRWVGDAIGLSESVRVRSASALAACGVAPTRFTDVGAAVEAAVAGMPAPGSSAWDAEVRHLLTIAFDLDGSGSLDTASELDAAGCGVLERLDAQLRPVFPAGLSKAYGIDGGEYLGDALGFDPAIRAAVARRLASCASPP